MSETIGLWCDECRCKFVRHVCHKGLPCGHSKAAAVSVYAKAFGRGGEHVSLQLGSWEAEFWIYSKNPDRDVMYVGRDARTLWGNEIHWRSHRDTETLTVGHWLKLQSEIVIRAFLSRWESCKEAPLARQVFLMGKAEGSRLKAEVGTAPVWDAAHGCGGPPEGGTPNGEWEI